MTLTFRCGHVAQVEESAASPVCPVCGREGVSAAQVRRPTFRGACTGPLAQTDLTIAPFRERIAVKAGT